MKNTALDFKQQYINWLNENIEQYKIEDNIYRLTVPFLDRHNDMIEIYIQNKSGKFIITDDGNTISDLIMSGFDIFNSPRRKNLLLHILKSYGVDLGMDNSLSISTSMSDMPLRKHLLIQCIQKVDDLFYLARPTIKSLFIEDVKNYLDDNDIRYISGASFLGKSKLPTQYDFSIPKSKNAPERNIKVINNFNRDVAKGIIFGWNDINDVLSHDSQLYTFIQDHERKISKDAIIALEEYSIRPVLWSKKNTVLKELVA